MTGQRTFIFVLRFAALFTAVTLTTLSIRFTFDFHHSEQFYAAGIFLLFAAGCSAYYLFLAPNAKTTNRLSHRDAATHVALSASRGLFWPLLVFAASRVGTFFGYEPHSVWTVCAILAAVLFVLAATFELIFGPGRPKPSNDPIFLRGTAILSPDAAFERAQNLLAHNGGPSIFWSGLVLPEAVSEGHFCIVGGTGSGKSLTIRLLMQTVLPRIRRRSGMRALVFDAKQDTVSVLRNMGLQAPVVLLNPFDARSVAWDIAKDVTSPAAALQLASIFIEEEQGRNSFFTKAARGLLGNVLKAFAISAPLKWNLADVVYVLKSKDLIRSLLTSVPETEMAYHEYFGRRETTAGDIELTIKANIEMLEPIAALWAHAKAKISLRDWFKSEYILVLGRDEDFKAPLDALNRVIFNQLVQLSLKQPNTERANTWFFLDELREAGKLDRINALIVEGRSHGIRVVIGFQDIDGLREVYGEHAANEIAGVCVNKAFLRLDSESTAQWAAKLIGDAEHREFTTTVSSNVQNNRETTSTRNESVVKREAALASQLMRSDMPDKQRKLFYGYYITPAIGVYAGRVHFGPLRDPARNVRNFVPHPDQHQYLPRRTDDDERRLGFSPSIAEREPSHDSPTPEPTMERITLDDLRQEIDP